jgi:hypothetical protein
MSMSQSVQLPEGSTSEMDAVGQYLQHPAAQGELGSPLEREIPATGVYWHWVDWPEVQQRRLC